MRPLVKICGLTRRQDAEEAARLGADHLGVIFYRKSPRCVNEAALPGILAAIPKGRAVMVDVAPQPGTITLRRELGFACFQIHFDVEGTLPSVLEGWAREAGRGALWLAPRLKPEDPLPEYVLELADTLVMDTYRPNVYGGTGETGEWERFNRLRRNLSGRRPDLRLALAGGLGPENVLTALRETGAGLLDFNSGVEDAPGIKNAAKMAAALAAVAQYAKGK